MSKNETTYCDNCGEQIPTGTAYIFEHLPCDIASANTGESATVCSKCLEMIDANENTKYFKRNHR
jgi:hypothetical protein